MAIPVFYFYLPLYSFWRMDDFSWGSTRLVVGEKGKKMVIHDEGKFDPKSIPLKSWNDYENELWDQESNHSYGTGLEPLNKSEYLGSHAGSMYGGRESAYGGGRESLFQGSHYSGYNTNNNNANRGLSPSGSYTDVRNASRAGSAYDYPAPRGTFYGGGGDTGSSGHLADTNSLYATSFYGQPPVQPNANSMYGMPVRGDTTDDLLGDNLSDAQLEASIRRITDSADLDTLTKKGVRKQLETEYGISLASRKDTINRIIESVLAE